MSLSTSRKINPLSESLIHKLNLYALSATAACVGVLALASPAESKVIYTKTHKTIDLIRGNTVVSIDLNGDGMPDFRVSANYARSGNYLQAGGVLTGNSILGYIGKRSRWFLSALPLDVRIGPKRNGFGLGGNMVSITGSSNGPTYTNGAWAGKDKKGLRYPHYLGFSFLIHGKVHYGWARLTTQVLHHQYPGLIGTLTGYAYETIPNKPIITGKTKGPDVITVQPGTLGSLARGHK